MKLFQKSSNCNHSLLCVFLCCLNRTNAFFETQCKIHCDLKKKKYPWHQAPLYSINTQAQRDLSFCCPCPPPLCPLSGVLSHQRSLQSRCQEELDERRLSSREDNNSTLYECVCVQWCQSGLASPTVGATVKDTFTSQAQLCVSAPSRCPLPFVLILVFVCASVQLLPKPPPRLPASASLWAPVSQSVLQNETHAFICIGSPPPCFSTREPLL